MMLTALFRSLSMLVPAFTVHNSFPERHIVNRSADTAGLRRVPFIDWYYSLTCKSCLVGYQSNEP